jgi:hypothetical protein
MEAKIMHQIDWLITEIDQNAANKQCDYSINDDLQMAVGE